MRALVPLAVTTLLSAACGSPDEAAGPLPAPVTAPPMAVPRLAAAAEPSEPPLLVGITARHNDVRRRVDPPADPPLPDLEWSHELARTAQAWADACRFEHNSGRGQLGENLAAHTDASGSAAAVVRQWAAETDDYDSATNTCAPGKVCGHYTQVVWQSTTHLGCGVASCTRGSPFPGFTNWQLWVCNYSPPGNWVGQRPYAAREPRI